MMNGEIIADHGPHGERMPNNGGAHRPYWPQSRIHGLRPVELVTDNRRAESGPAVQFCRLDRRMAGLVVYDAHGFPPSIAITVAMFLPRRREAPSFTIFANASGG